MSYVQGQDKEGLFIDKGIESTFWARKSSVET